MSFEGIQNGSIQKEKTIRNLVRFHAAEEAIKLFEKHFKNNESPVNSETIRDLFYEFLSQQIENTELYTSKEHTSTAFIWSRVDSGNIAKQLYAKYARALPELHPIKEIFWFLHTRVRERVRGALYRFPTQSGRTERFRATTRSARAISRQNPADFVRNTFELRPIHTAKIGNRNQKPKWGRREAPTQTHSRQKFPNSKDFSTLRVAHSFANTIL